MAAAERVLLVVVTLVTLLVLVRGTRPDPGALVEWDHQRVEVTAAAAALSPDSGDRGSVAALDDGNTVPAAVLYGKI